MDILKMLSDVRQERKLLEEAEFALERLAAGSGKRMGRPPAWVVALKVKTKKRGRPPDSKNEK